MSARRLPEAIQWHEGMLLAPQHFQQLSLRHEELVHYHSVAIAPYHWGVIQRGIDSDVLASGLLRVTRLEAVMPDGLIVSRHPGEEAPLEIDLAPWADAMKAAPVTVWLTVPARRPGASPVRGELPRYDSVEGEEIADESTGDGHLRVPRLRPRLSLRAGERPPDKYDSFPIARVTRDRETFVLADYVPPSLRVPPGSRLHEIGSEVAQRLRAKAAFLAEQARSPLVASRAPQLLETKSLIHGLVGALPPFEALLHAGTAHPFALYLALTGLVGHVAGVGRSLIPPVLEPYDHNDARAAFARARDFIFQAVSEGVLESHLAFPFDLQKGRFQIEFDEAWRQRDLILGVRGPGEMSDDEVAAWMDQALIGSEPLMPGLRDRRIRGAGRQRIERAGELVPTPGVALFRLDAQPGFVEAHRLLQVWNANDPGDTPRVSEIVLYVKNPPRSGS